MGARALLVAAVLLVSCEARPAPTPSPEPTPTLALATPVGGAPVEEKATPRATICPRAAPPLAAPLVFQNGNLDLGVPYELGFVQFIVVPCRDVASLVAKYGLGAVTRVISEPSDANSDPDDIRGRYFKAAVPAGREPELVAGLAAHADDFQYVEFAFVSVATVPESGLRTASSVTPAQGPAGTSFTMRICCFEGGTPVTKTFRLPSGREIVVHDVAHADRTVDAGWGGSPDDERGVYMVTVTAGGRGSLVRFRVT